MNQIKLTGIRAVDKYVCHSRTEFRLEQASCPLISPSVVCEVSKLLFRDRSFGTRLVNNIPPHSISLALYREHIIWGYFQRQNILRVLACPAKR